MRSAATTGKRIGYGWLYNWYAVDDARGLAPDGWNIPTDAQWTELTDYLIAEYAHITSSNVGGALKSTRMEWGSPNTDATNEFRLSALPGGDRRSNGNFYDLGTHGFWWSSTARTSALAWLRRIHYNYGSVERVSDTKARGFGQRCVQSRLKDELDGDTGTLEDIDGNTYNWVVIGEYRWMTENLRTTKYKDGTDIPEIRDDTDWENLTTGARCAYNNDHYLVFPPSR